MTEPRVHSPYGKHVPTELPSVYGLNDLDSLVALMCEKLDHIWGLRAENEEVHVAFGIALRFRAEGDL